MKLLFKTGEIELRSDEFIEYHQGREHEPHDTSIMNIYSLTRAEELSELFKSLYPYPSYRMDEPLIKGSPDGFEVEFLLDNFAPFKIIP